MAGWTEGRKESMSDLNRSYNAPNIPTPRTDEFVQSLIYEIHTNFRLTKAFARQLERELAQLRADYDRLIFENNALRKGSNAPPP